ncbi:alpha-L-fucosidase [Rugosimonospora africana]|uniref:Beta-galactosidase trimerisation domain-containing protein n=1 Tax=Rugosimonospora africana TaxID=556532 RepID=A0A8J3VV54_9ACTN|nr:alpha-L-fucosidase [Rugosimonospora africana]GIH19378.1 hypothetical protein Raf01_75500 [Rugosimonospora africana]
MIPSPQPTRAVHLDFHNGPDVPAIGADFEPDAFAQTFAEAGVESVTLFAKCHHGHLYYETNRPERHPGLAPGFDLLGSQIDALHRVGIRTPIYLSVQCDEYAANLYPQWRALDDSLAAVKSVSGGAFEAGWQILDMSSPYQDYLSEQIEEVVDRYSTDDGIFLDMCWDQPSVSTWAIAGARRAGLDPSIPADRRRYAAQVSRQYMARYADLVGRRTSAGRRAGVWFNSRPKLNLREESTYVDHIEVEALSTGGWGYAYLPYVGRFVRSIGLPALAMTGRFHRSWGDNGALKPRAELRYETTSALAQGLGVSVGDVLPPRGMPQRPVYELIGDAFAHLRRCEPFVARGAVRTDIAVVVDPARGDDPDMAGLGAVRALQQLRQQFDIVGPDSDLSPYRVTVVPETTVVDAALQRRLEVYLAGGGSLLVAGMAAMAADGSPVLPLGVDFHGESEFSRPFFRTGADSGFDTVLYGRPLLMSARGKDVRVLSRLVEPFFEREWDHFSGHEYTPADRPTDWALLAVRGRTATIAAPIFTIFGEYGLAAHRDVIGDALDALLPEPLLRADGPAHLETSVIDTVDARVVNLVSFLSTRVGTDLDVVSDPFPLVDVDLEVRMDDPPAQVTREPAGQALPFTWERGYLRTRVTVLDGHALVVARPAAADRRISQEEGHQRNE